MYSTPKMQSIWPRKYSTVFYSNIFIYHVDHLLCCADGRHRTGGCAYCLANCHCCYFTFRQKKIGKGAPSIEWYDYWSCIAIVLTDIRKEATINNWTNISEITKTRRLFLEMLSVQILLGRNMQMSMDWKWRYLGQIGNNTGEQQGQFEIVRCFNMH